MKILVLANQKGGVGKSAIATQLAHYMHRQGRSVLVIDLDHQQNTSRPLLANRGVTAATFSASDIFTEATVRALPAAPFVLIAGDDRLSTLERHADQHNAFASRYRAALDGWNTFDVCIVDTNPNPDIRYAAALICAGFVLAPIQLNQEAIGGISAVLGHPRYGISKIRTALNPDLRFLGILPNQVEATPFQRANLQQLVAGYGAHLLSGTHNGDIRYGYLHKRTAVAEAQAAGAFIADMTKTSARDAWKEIRPVFDMILNRMDLMPVGGPLA